MGNPNVVAGATTSCTFGLAPGSLLPINPTVLIENRPAARISDIEPMATVMPFGMCQSLANPTVAAATAAALGVLTPMPCVPVPVGTWKPGAAQTVITGQPALTSGSTLNCAYGGVIAIGMPGSMRTLAG